MHVDMAKKYQRNNRKKDYGWSTIEEKNKTKDNHVLLCAVENTSKSVLDRLAYFHLSSLETTHQQKREEKKAMVQSNPM